MNKNNKIVFLLVVICVCLFSIFALASESSDSTSTKATRTEETVKTSEIDKTSETDKTSESSSTQTEFKVGETFIYNGLKITYVSSSDWESDNQFIQPAIGNKFIRLSFHVANDSKYDHSVSVYSFKCYADGYDCSKTYNADDLSASLSSGRSTDGAVYFEVPINAKEIEIEYEYNILSNKRVKFIFEGDKDSGLTFEKDIAISEGALRVGDIVESNGLKIKYLKADEYEVDNIFLQPADGNRYVYIELEVENTSNSEHTISYILFDCYADGSACDGFYGMDDALSATISPGRKALGTIAFEVPENANVIEFELENNIWTSSKVVFLYE